MKREKVILVALSLVLTATILAVIACGGGNSAGNLTPAPTASPLSPPPPPAPPPPPPPPPPAPAPAPPPDPICACTPTEADSSDYRHAAKHVDLPTGVMAQEISIAAILAWEQPPDPAFNAPRAGRELQLFHVAKAYLQAIRLQPGDCDLHIEVSDVPDKTAPRIIVETPVDSSYCVARRTLESQLAAHGVNNLEDKTYRDIVPALPAEITGLAFQDLNHTRGSQFVATVWELHPAVVKIVQ